MKTIVIQNRDAALLSMSFMGHAVKSPASELVGSRDRRPTVLHFIYSIGGGGAEAMLVNLVEAFDNTRFRTVVVAINARPWPQAAQRLHNAGAKLYDLEGTAYLERETLSKLRAIIKAERPAIVQTWMHHADLIGGWIARLTLGCKVIWSVHCREIHRNHGDSDRKMAVFRQALALSSRFVPHSIVSCSLAAIEDHARLGYPRKKMTWIPNGIDAERFVPSAAAREATRGDLEIASQAPVIGFVGRFHEMKDLPTFFRAAALLQERRPDVHFVFCGGLEIELSAEEREAFALIPNPDQVRFVPFRVDPWRLYPAFDIFSLSSRTEACPMTVMEALSCGVMCITTEVGDCAHLLEDVGHTVPIHDSAALAHAWEVALDVPTATRQEISRMSRQRVLERLTIAGAAQHYEDAYSSLLGIKS